MNRATRHSSAETPAIVALACWLDLLGYGAMMDAAGFDPTHPKAQKPLARLRAFHRIIAKHSSGGFPTLVMNDGAVAYSSVEPSRSDKVWRFLNRCWALYSEATTTDQRNEGPGLRAVVAVGLRARGSNRGIVAQDGAHSDIIDRLAAGAINADRAKLEARNVRRSFDIVPQLQANFAFARAYEAEQAGSRAGLEGPNLFLDIALFRHGIPEWIRSGPSIAWVARRPSLSTSFVALREIAPVEDEEARAALRTGSELIQHLRFQSP